MFYWVLLPQGSRDAYFGAKKNNTCVWPEIVVLFRDLSLSRNNIFPRRACPWTPGAHVADVVACAERVQDFQDVGEAPPAQRPRAGNRGAQWPQTSNLVVTFQYFSLYFDWIL